jgi:hypothetical protein
MSYYRSYFEKNNTVIKKSQVNTAKNPNTEIYYGAGLSKFIFKIDITDLKQLVDNGDYVITTGTTHTLHLTNTIFGDEALMGTDRGNGNLRATSFDLIVFKLTEYWDEGLGFDYDRTYDQTTGEALYDIRPSNWFNRTTLNTWSHEGFSGATVVNTMHFDLGNEDLHLDITNYVNDLLDGDINYGLGISFAPVYEEIELNTNQSVSFFTKYTQTFFEPYVETFFDNQINDNREDFVEKMEQNLYLYVTKGTNFHDLDSFGTVDILDSQKNVVPGLTGLVPIKIKKGVYKITLAMDGILCDGKRFFYDKWQGLVLDGVSISDVTQRFVPKPYTSFYTIGQNPTELQRFAIQFFGLKLNEKIVRGNKRKIVVTFRSINNSIPVLFDDVYYRIFIKEGRTQVDIFDWTKLDKTNENSFIFDTTYMIPREYHLQIKAKTHSEEIFYKETLNFEIVSEK